MINIQELINNKYNNECLHSNTQIFGNRAKENKCIINYKIYIFKIKTS